MGNRRKGFTHSKVTRKTKNPKNISFNIQAIQRKWDKKKTLTENYKDLGLALSLNDNIKGKEISKQIHKWDENEKQNSHLDIYRSDSEIIHEIVDIFSNCESKKSSTVATAGPFLFNGILFTFYL